MKIRVFTAFSGYDSQCMALDRLHRHNPDFNYELVGWAEIDKYAIAAHNAVYPQYADRNYGDISKIDWAQVPDFDLFTYSSPCQDFSQAGKQAGGEQGSGTRSSLLWECERAIIAKRPKYLLMENVAALVSQKFIRLFNRWQLTLEGCGYTNVAQVLNAKDYGVPQNRERIFMVSIHEEGARYEFPKPMPLPIRLKDVLEPQVDERYYLSDSSLEGYTPKSNQVEPINTDAEGNASCIKACYYKAGAANFKEREDGFGQTAIKEPIVLGWVRDEKGNVVKRPPVEVANCVTSGKRDNTQNYVVEPTMIQQVGDRGNGYWSEKEVAFTIPANPMSDRGQLVKEPVVYDDYNGKVRADQDTIGTITCEAGNPARRHSFKIIEPSYRIRKLTERECFRLMDVPEEYIDKIQAAGISRSQQYKMAGNSIVVSCLYHIWRRLFIDTKPTILTLF